MWALRPRAAASRRRIGLRRSPRRLRVAAPGEHVVAEAAKVTAAVFGG
jgi:hypothetical protein